MSVLEFCFSVFKGLKLKSSRLKNGTNQMAELPACLAFVNTGTIKRCLLPKAPQKMLLKMTGGVIFSPHLL